MGWGRLFYLSLSGRYGLIRGIEGGNCGSSIRSEGGTAGRSGTHKGPTASLDGLQVWRMVGKRYRQPKVSRSGKLDGSRDTWWVIGRR